MKRGLSTILPKELEQAFVDYIKFRVRICYGMTIQECRRAALAVAESNDITVPASWNRNKMAGKEWFMQFRVRHPEITLRKPEPCSLSRATSFNAHNVRTFFENLAAVLKKHPRLAEGTRIYNLDETALTTVQTPEKVLTTKDTRQLNSMTSGERGTLVTACCIICSDGTYLPPSMVFPRVNFKQHMTNGAPTGTLGLAAKSGWMTAELFEQTFDHFVTHTSSSRENPSLLIYDNHESHVTLPVINKAREHGVEILTLPPHCSNKMQPLDITVYKSLKTFYNRAADTWLLSNPGRTITIYEVSKLFGEAFLLSFTPANIISGFRSSGIFPYNPDVFPPETFGCSFVTDRPEPDETPRTATPAPAASVATAIELPIEFSSSTFKRSPEEVLGFPKAKERKQKNNDSRKKKSSILTSTPEKLELERKQAEKDKTQAGKDERARKRVRKRLNPEVTPAPVLKKRGRKPKPKPVRRTPSPDSSDDEDSDFGFQPLSSSDDDPETFSDLEEDDETWEPELNEFYAVKFDMDEQQHKIKHYIGQILECKGTAFKIKFLRKTTGVNRFVFPNIDDIAWIQRLNIVKKVNPLQVGSTSRQNRVLSILHAAANFENLY